MKDIIKKPMFWYTAALAAAVLWPVLIWGVYLPSAKKSWQNDKAEYEKAEQTIRELLTVDPERLDFANTKDAAAEFDYATAVQSATDFCRIPPTNYKLSSRAIITSGGQKNQSADISLKEVDIVKFAKFLSTIQLRWSNLQCTKATLKKRKGVPDSWDVDLTFKYFH